MTTTEPDTVGTGALPVLLTLANIGLLLEGSVVAQTVYKWNVTANGKQRVLPEPDIQVGGRRPTPLWRESVILEFIESKGMKPNKRALAKIRKAQGHPANSRA
mgnify:CR=1 FL=1